jgi:hypothetical protein
VGAEGAAVIKGNFTTGIIERIEKVAADKMERAVRAIHKELLDNTPVWSGEVVANYQVTVGAPATGTVQHNEQGDPGPTNSMPLGAEPRRAANEEIARQSLEAVDFSKVHGSVFITNNVPHAVPLNYGELPSEDTSRTPAGGFVDKAIEEARRALK